MNKRVEKHIPTISLSTHRQSHTDTHTHKLSHSEWISCARACVRVFECSTEAQRLPGKCDGTRNYLHVNRCVNDTRHKQNMKRVAAPRHVHLYSVHAHDLQWKIIIYIFTEIFVHLCGKWYLLDFIKNHKTLKCNKRNNNNNNVKYDEEERTLLEEMVGVGWW